MACFLVAPYVEDSVHTRQNFQARALGDFHDRVSSAARAWGHKFLPWNHACLHGQKQVLLLKLSYWHLQGFKPPLSSWYVWYPSNDRWNTQFMQISMSHDILPFLCRILAWEHQDRTVALWWLMLHSNTLQPPSESCCSSPCVMVRSHCSEGGFR